jgi:hypothetical protein
LKSISGVTFFFGNLATGHFSGIFFLKIAGSGDAGSNDTGLSILSCPGAESISGHKDKQGDIFGYYNIDYSLIVQLGL